MSSACEVEISLSRDDRRARWGILVNQVSQAYCDILSLPCLVAVTYDEEVKPNRELTAVHIEYKADVENAVAKGIGNDQYLFKQWVALVESDCETDSPNSDVMLRLALKLGPIFEQRELQPSRYFKRIKKGRPDRRSAVGSA
jgi:hypothetical protein